MKSVGQVIHLSDSDSEEEPIVINVKPASISSVKVANHNHGSSSASQDGNEIMNAVRKFRECEFCSSSYPCTSPCCPTCTTPGKATTASTASVAFWNCANCSIENLPESHACVACYAPRSGDLENFTAKRNSMELGEAALTPDLVCRICTNVLDASANVYRLDNCQHAFCPPCLQPFVAQRLDSAPGMLNYAINCPDRGCGAELSFHDLEQSVGRERSDGFAGQLLSRVWSACGHKTREEAKVPCVRCSEMTVIHQLPKQLLRELRQWVPGKGGSCARAKTSIVLHGADGNDAGPVCMRCRLTSCTQCEGGDEGQQSQGGALCSMYILVCIVSLVKRLETVLKMEMSAKSQSRRGTRRVGKEKESVKEKGPSHSVWARGTGYGGNEYSHSRRYGHSSRHHDPAALSAQEDKAKKAQGEWDATVMGVFEEMRGILALLRSSKTATTTTPASSSAHGRVVVHSLPAAACAVLLKDPTLWQLLRLLTHNDSFMDIADRDGLFWRLFALLRELGDHRQLLPLLCCPQPSAASAAADAGNCSTTTGAAMHGYEDTATVMEGLRSMRKGAQFVQSRGKHGTEDEDEAMYISLANEICDCVDTLESRVASWRAGCQMGVASADRERGPGDTPNNTDAKRKRSEDGADGDHGPSSGSDDGDEEAKQHKERLEKYKEALGGLQFRQVDLTDGGGAYHHYFRRHLEEEERKGNGGGGTGNGVQARARRINKEVPSLATSLPLEWDASIHVCVDDTNLSLIKCLIFGPAGTPYQNGVFLFDIYLPPEYPERPPKVHFLTTGGGTVRFNPNLYHCGKVCLSLIGTWHGPGWQPGKSTILQVLISIQSLILVAEPYYNEPGNEQWASKPQSDKYNNEQRLNTLKHAILPFLKSPPKFFEEIVEKHFQFKREELLAQARDWVLGAEDTGSQLALKEAFRTLEKAFGVSVETTTLREEELPKLKPRQASSKHSSLFLPPAFLPSAMWPAGLSTPVPPLPLPLPLPVVVSSPGGVPAAKQKSSHGMLTRTSKAGKQQHPAAAAGLPGSSSLSVSSPSSSAAAAPLPGSSASKMMMTWYAASSPGGPSSEHAASSAKDVFINFVDAINAANSASAAHAPQTKLLSHHHHHHHHAAAAASAPSAGPSTGVVSHSSADWHLAEISMPPSPKAWGGWLPPPPPSLPLYLKKLGAPPLPSPTPFFPTSSPWGGGWKNVEVPTPPVPMKPESSQPAKLRKKNSGGSSSRSQADSKWEGAQALGEKRLPEPALPLEDVHEDLAQDMMLEKNLLLPEDDDDDDNDDEGGDAGLHHQWAEEVLLLPEEEADLALAQEMSMMHHHMCYGEVEEEEEEQQELARAQELSMQQMLTESDHGWNLL